MQTTPLSLAVTVASAVAKQISGSSRANSADKKESVADHASATNFKKAFRQALADNSTPQSERSIMPAVENKIDRENEPVVLDSGLTVMLPPELQALVDSLPRPDITANTTLLKAETTGVNAEPALATPLQASVSAPALSAIPANAATLAQPDMTSASTTPRLPAATNTADTATSTALPAFTLPDLPVDVTLPVAMAAQNQPPAEALLATSALATPNQTVSNPAANHIATRIGSPEWDKAFGQQMVWISKSSSLGSSLGSNLGSSQTASLSLNPPELGPIKIVLQISDAQAYASFSSAQPEVRQAIESALPKLREMLGESGLQLAQTDINSGNPQPQDDAAFQHSQNSRQASIARSANLSDIDNTATSASLSELTSAGRALVDIFA